MELKENTLPPSHHSDTEFTSLSLLPSKDTTQIDLFDAEADTADKQLLQTAQFGTYTASGITSLNQPLNETHSAKETGASNKGATAHGTVIVPPSRMYRYDRPITDRSDLWINSAEEAVIKSPEMALLRKRKQMSSYYTETGKYAPHDRFEHSLEVLYIADLLMRRLQSIPAVDKAHIRMAAILHDIGHPAFSHTGETIINEMRHRSGHNSEFDHDVRGVEMIRYGGIGKILTRFNYDKRVVANILDDQHKEDPKATMYRYIVKEIADRLAYLELDFMGTNFCRDLKQDAYDLFRLFVEDIEIKGNRVTFSSTDLMNNALELRRKLLQEVTQSARSEMVKEVISSGVRLAVRNGDLRASDLTNMGDNEVIQRFPEKYRHWMSEGVENYVRPIVGLTIANLEPNGRSDASNPAKRENLKSSILRNLERAGVHIGDLFIVNMPVEKTPKQVLVELRDPDQTVPAFSKLKEEDIFFFVAAELLPSNAASMERITQITRGAVTEFFRKNFSRSTVNWIYGENLFLPRDPSLFQDDTATLKIRA